jgi:hypothetical protein
MSARDQALALRKRMCESIIGQEHIIERLLISLLANGNLLPGRASAAGPRRRERASSDPLPPLNPS